MRIERWICWANTRTDTAALSSTRVYTRKAFLCQTHCNLDMFERLASISLGRFTSRWIGWIGWIETTKTMTCECKLVVVLQGI